MHRDRDEFDGCFSYVPFRPGDSSLFARPSIDLPGLSHGQTQKFQVLGSGKEQVSEYWKSVTDQVTENGRLSLGIEVDEL